MKYYHIGIFDWGNAGDTVLSQATEDLIDKDGCWQKTLFYGGHIRSEAIISHVNRFVDAVVIGGGGFLIPSTTATNWQCGISSDTFKEIKKPIIVFGLGFNKFRYSQDFNERFIKSINALVERADFFSLRNRGSIKALSPYLKPQLREKLRYQPDACSLLSYIYPQFTNLPLRKGIVFEPAMDCPDFRFGDRRSLILKNIVSSLDDFGNITVSLHRGRGTDLDEEIIKWLTSFNIPHTVERLFWRPPEEVMDFYARSPLTIGMRGHGIMIPFGLGNPFIPIVSHDKLNFFCDDIGFGHGQDVEDTNLTENIINAVNTLDNDAFREKIRKAKENLWEITQQNLTEIRTILKK